MKTGNIIMIVGGVVLFVAALVLTIVGIVTHKEAIFMDESKSWDRNAFPLLVRGSRYASDGTSALEGQQRRALESAIYATNSRLGFEAFREAPRGVSAGVIVYIGVPYSEDWESAGGQFRLLGNDDRYTACHIMTSNTGGLLSRTLEHEFGHCLGLAHDNFTLSIMYPVQRPVANLQSTPWITDHDRAALRDRYAPVD